MKMKQLCQPFLGVNSWLFFPWLVLALTEPQRGCGRGAAGIASAGAGAGFAPFPRPRSGRRGLSPRPGAAGLSLHFTRPQPSSRRTRAEGGTLQQGNVTQRRLQSPSPRLFSWGKGRERAGREG